MRLAFLFLSIILCSSQLLLAQQYILIKDGEMVKDSLKVTKKRISFDDIRAREMAFYGDDTSKIAWIKNFRYGKQNGVYKSFFPTGELMEFGVFGNGKRHGEWTIYNKSGEIIIKGKYKDDEKHGFWAYRRDQCYGKYKKGKKKGIWRCFSDGKKAKKKY